MPATTPIAGYPFPEDPDRIDIAGDIRSLAIALDLEPGIRRIFPNKTLLDAGWAPANGAHAYTTLEQQEWLRNNNQWVRAGTEAGTVPGSGAAKITYAAESGTPTGTRTLAIATFSDPNNLVTQVGTDVQIDKGGIWTIQMGVMNLFDSFWDRGTAYELQSPISTKLRRWYVNSGPENNVDAFSFTAKFAQGARLRWRVTGNRVYGSTMDLIPIIFTS